MNFLQFAIWGAYLTCMGTYLHTHGLGMKIGIFYYIRGQIGLLINKKEDKMAYCCLH